MHTLQSLDLQLPSVKLLSIGTDCMKVGNYCPDQRELNLLSKCLPNMSRVMLLSSKVGYHKKEYFTEKYAAEVVAAFDNLAEIAICTAFII